MSLSNADKVTGNDSFAEESIRILREAYLSKKLVLFAGSEMDAGSGIPCRKDAVKEICSRLHLEYHQGADDVRIPQYYFQAHGNEQYVELCKKIFCDQQQLRPNAFHKKIADFHVHTIITTSYSDLLQQELYRRGYLYTTVCQDKELSDVHNENRIVKMHGDFAHNNFVLKEEDYFHYHSNFRKIAAYVKSVLANNIVLFAGCSLQDPEIRQIFSWIKEIAGGETLQAYMLENDRDYRKIEFEYYKNNGVGIIHTNSFGDQKQDALLMVMDRICSGSGEQLSDLEDAKNYLMPFLNLHYILRKNVEKGLSKCKLGIHADKIWVLGQQEKKRQETKQQEKKRQETKENETNQLAVKLTEYFKQDLVTTENPYSVLAGALRKSGIRQIEHYLREEKENQIYAQTTEIPHLENELFPLLMTFDYEGIRKQTEDFALFDQEQPVYAKLAFGYYLLEDYASAYRVLCKAVKVAVQNKQYDQYYLSQLNRQRIANRIKNGDGLPELPQDIYDQIQEETADIDPDSIAAELSGVSFLHASVLKEIDSFQLHVGVFQDIYEMVQTIEERQKTGCFDAAGRADLEKLRLYVKDYYLYLISNGMMADRSLPAEKAFLSYLKCMLKNIGLVDAFVITNFELFLMIRYLSPGEMLDMLTQYSIDVLPSEPDGVAVMKTIVRNLQSAERKETHTELWNSIVLCAWIGPDEELMELAIDGMTSQLHLQRLDQTKERIVTVLRVCAQKNLFRKKQDGDFQISNYAAGRLWNRLTGLILAETDTRTIQKAGRLMQDVAAIVYSVYQEGYAQEIRGLLCREKAFSAVKIYPYCDANNQEKIRQFFADWKEDSWRCYEIYADIVMYDIIEPRAEFEQKILQSLDEIKKISSGDMSEEYEDVLVTLYRLFIDKKLAHTGEFREALLKSDRPLLQFLGDMETFDYSAFQIEWLAGFSDKMLKKTAFHKTARSSITRRFMEEVAKGKTDRSLLNIYFQYFTGMERL